MDKLSKEKPKGDNQLNYRLLKKEKVLKPERKKPKKPINQLFETTRKINNNK
jgi:hypothetical protein